jgi:hypothetical protein
MNTRHARWGVINASCARLISQQQRSLCMKSKSFEKITNGLGFGNTQATKTTTRVCERTCCAMHGGGPRAARKNVFQRALEMK